MPHGILADIGNVHPRTPQAELPRHGEAGAVGATGHDGTHVLQSIRTHSPAFPRSSCVAGQSTVPSPLSATR